MNCSEFLQRYPECHDGGLRDGRLLRRLETHRRRCRRCAHWAESLERGIRLLRDAQEISPSAAFRSGLNKRLRSEVAIGDPITPTNAGLAAALLLAAAVGLFVFEGFTTPAAVEPQAAARLAEPAFPDSVDTVPATDVVDVTIPAFARTTLQFHSSQAPLGTQAVFSP